MSDESNAQAPDRLRNVLDALAKYHTHLLQKATLQNQSPAELEQTEDILNSVGYELLRRWNANTFIPNTDTDTDELQECIQTIQNNIEPWDPRLSVHIPYWIRRMFFDAPFVISKEHIERLHRNSQHKPEDE